MIKVNGKVISEKEFDMACAEKKHLLRKNSLDKNEIGDVLNILTDAVLMLEVAERENIPVDNAEIEHTISKIKSNFKTEEEFNDALSKTGDSIETLKERILKNLKLRNFVQKKFFEETTVSDDDAQKYYDEFPDRFNKPEEVRASHILFSEADKDKALEVHEKITEGQENFEEHAKTHSVCPSGRDGGDLGFFDRGKMVPEFERAAFATPVGEISDLVQSQFGYHIIKVTDKKEGGKYGFDDIKDSLKQSMANSIVNNKIRKYAEKLREKAEIVIDKDILASKS
ncbi:MAG: peptidylprolyl isomerase [Candidatus Delongbacteria bacterium]|nr:peptidylprolyl isomerase [Candidatus Delongbacteria bacterium]